MIPEDFQKRLLAWYDDKGRKDLPWQQAATPYRVWISEIMLQQTQVTTVIPYFLKFIRRFPDVDSLASAPLDAVLHLWSGLGYYARARNLHKAARIIAERGKFPDDLNALCALPGIGRSTAGAILSIAFKQHQPILDGNVKRVLARFHALDGWPGDAKISAELWHLSERYTPVERVGDYTQAIMDLGATLCTRASPDCPRCPVLTACQALLGSRTAELPTPRPRKTIPVRKSFMLVLGDGNDRYYLEQRPPAGIWGGLWCFPEYSERQAVERWCAARHIELSALKWLPQRRHTFSHFHLDYTPVLAVLENPINVVMEANGGLWYNPRQDRDYGLPAPVGRLLEQLLIR